MKTAYNIKRIYWIDNLKALGIFFIVLGHNVIGRPAKIYLFSFHVPLFFFISGYLFDPRKYQTFKKFSNRKFRTILLPYFFFAFISYIYWYFITRNSGEGVDYLMDPKRIFFGIFYSNGISNWLEPNVALWFLTCLFVVNLFFWIFFLFFKNKKHLAMALFITSVIGYLDYKYLPFDFRLPWSMDVALTAVVFYGVGYLLKDWINEVLERLTWKNSFLLLPFLGISYYLSCLNGPVEMNFNYYGNYFYFYGSAWAGIAFFTGASKLIGKNKILEFIGFNTIIILGFHLFFKKYPVKFWFYTLTGLPLNVPCDSLRIGFIYAIYQLILCLPFIYIFNKYLPFILGRKK